MVRRMRPSQMTPDWLFQVMWFGASVGGTGAIWYFLSERNYHVVLWTGFATDFSDPEAQRVSAQISE